MTPAQREAVRAVVRDAGALADGSVRWQETSTAYLATVSAVLSVVSARSLQSPERTAGEVWSELCAFGLQVDLESTEAPDAVSRLALVRQRLWTRQSYRDVLHAVGVGLGARGEVRALERYDQRQVSAAVLELEVFAAVSDATHVDDRGPILAVTTTATLDDVSHTTSEEVESD